MGIGDPEKTEIFPNYTQWEASSKKSAKSKEKKQIEGSSATQPLKPKLSYQEKKEFEGIEGNITKLEEKMRSLNHLLEEKEIAENPTRLSEICTAIGLVQTEIERLYIRWDELDKKS